MVQALQVKEGYGLRSSKLTYSRRRWLSK